MQTLVSGALLLASFLGTRYGGLERTVRAFARAGRLQRAARLCRARGPQEVRAAVERGYQRLPLPIECLEQAIVTWYLLNVGGHAATLKIGATLSPLESHAWVESGGELFGETPHIADMHVVAEYPGF